MNARARVRIKAAPGRGSLPNPDGGRQVDEKTFVEVRRTSQVQSWINKGIFVEEASKPSPAAVEAPSAKPPAKKN